jgi:hypothetical protein
MQRPRSVPGDVLDDCIYLKLRHQGRESSILLHRESESELLGITVLYSFPPFYSSCHFSFWPKERAKSSIGRD